METAEVIKLGNISLNPYRTSYLLLGFIVIIIVVTCSTANYVELCGSQPSLLDR